MLMARGGCDCCFRILTSTHGSALNIRLSFCRMQTSGLQSQSHRILQVLGFRKLRGTIEAEIYPVAKHEVEILNFRIYVLVVES